MSSNDTAPSDDQQQDIDGFADALYELLQARGQSLGVMDIALESDGWFIDVELMFAVGPDMGVSVHTGAGEARYCELVGEDRERWLDGQVENLDVFGSEADEHREAQAMLVLTGLLDARRPLLTKA
ncbi:MAG: hypothetical protein JWN72_149 [Thermoleophilia bacterium]|nr:hypothetical protein [Thermoleophilia bacterium]